MSSHHDFDFIDSDLLASAEIKKKKLHIKDKDGKALESFKCVIVPSTTILPTAALQKLDEFAKAGGIVLGAGLLPTESIENGSDPVIVNTAKQLFGLDPVEVESSVLAGKNPGAAGR
jgi:hypothetical protein